MHVVLHFVGFSDHIVSRMCCISIYFLYHMLFSHCICFFCFWSPSSLYSSSVNFLVCCLVKCFYLYFCCDSDIAYAFSILMGEMLLYILCSGMFFARRIPFSILFRIRLYLNCVVIFPFIDFFARCALNCLLCAGCVSV